jgi:selenocysteine lyase/cysteine desulfurase
MKTNSRALPLENSTVLLKKLFELKKTLSANSVSTVEDEKSDSRSSKAFNSSLEELQTDTELDNSVSSCQRIEMIRGKIIGLRTVFKSPFGFNLETVYADHTATNRAYESIEDVISSAKLLAANPHTEFNHFGKYSTALMDYSQVSILSSFEADPKDYVALPTGNGSTGAIEKTLKILKLLEKQEKTTIFLTPYEHHSNILPWIELYEDIKVLPSTENGDLTYGEIESALTSD